MTPAVQHLGDHPLKRETGRKFLFKCSSMELKGGQQLRQSPAAGCDAFLITKPGLFIPIE